MQPIYCSGGDEPVSEGERARGAEGDDAAAAPEAVRGVQGDREPIAHSRPYGHASPARETVSSGTEVRLTHVAIWTSFSSHRFSI